MKYSQYGILISVIFLTGCLSTNTPIPDDPAYAPVRAEEQPITSKATGSLYQEQYALNLFETNRAKRIGDILTIELQEKTEGTQKATSKVKKENTTDVTNPTLFGTTPQFGVPGVVPLASNKNNNLTFNLQSNRDFTGEGESTQNNKLEGTITVTVVDIQSNGNLAVRGEKWLYINQSKEYIRIKGIVRPDDISSDNTVPSYRLANARIHYSGTGQNAKSNIMGWLAKFFISALMPW